MEPVQVLRGRGIPLDESDVDTDQIIPSEWLKRVERTGFGAGLFSEWRENPEFVLNQPQYAGASILVSGPNFGIGSSREHAVWALVDYGIHAVVSSRIADIFKNNSTRSGLVPVVVDQAVARSLLDAVTADPQLEITIDVEARTLSAPGTAIAASFEIDDDARERLLGGLDDIAITLTHADEIARFEATRPQYLPAVS